VTATTAKVRNCSIWPNRWKGLTRNVGMHAGGVLIAPGKLTDFCPLYQATGSDVYGVAVRQGRCRGGRLVKFDFLGLRNLTIIELAVEYIKRRSTGEKLDLNALPSPTRPPTRS
jgi:DNA polymerase III subunit alpha